MAEPADLVASLIAASVDERARLLRETEPLEVLTAIGLLGGRHDQVAAEILGVVDAVVDDRAVRKAARRELHRLRSAGIDAPTSALPVTSAEPVQSEQRARLSEAWATDYDPTGSRAVWLLAERPLGGAWLGSALLNDLAGLEEISAVDTTRKRVLRQLQEHRHQGTWVSVPAEYALRLVREAVDISRERGSSLPTRYRAFRDAFGEADGPPERPLVFETVSPLQASFSTESLEHTPRLMAEPELQGWHVAVPESLREQTLEVVRAPFKGLLVPMHPPEQQALTLVAEAARQVLTPTVRRALRRRLEETGYIFVATERLAAARLAVSASRAIDDAHLPPERHPLLRLLVVAGLARLVRSERIGPRPAPEVLVELVERAAEQSAQSGGAVEARPSGLILPR